MGIEIEIEIEIGKGLKMVIPTICLLTLCRLRSVKHSPFQESFESLPLRPYLVTKGLVGSLSGPPS